METPFYQVDVFSDQLFGGNPLAVFLQGQDFKETQFQQVAREMNLSETTFVLPSSHAEADFDVRIFTPEKEIPFAGHPTLGTAYILRHSGMATTTALTLNFKAGLIPVQVRDDEKIFMTQPPGKILQTFSDKERVSRVLGLNLNELDGTLPIQTVSTGFPALLVPVVSLDAMTRIQLDLPLLKSLLDEVRVDMIYPFSPETCDAGNSIHARGFAPFIGIQEDPATGSVAGALGYYLNEKDPARRKITIEQGYEIKRPGHIFVEIGSGKANPIHVGGATRMVFKGSLYLE